MTYLNGSGIITDVLSMTQKGATIRPKVLLWLNIAAQKLAVVRPWLFLAKSVTLNPVANVITKPADYGEFSFINLGTVKSLDTRNRLSAGETLQADNSRAGYGYPTGFTEDATTITLHGEGFTAPVTLGYIIEPPVIVDDATATVWPVKCRAVFMEAVLTAYTKYDYDERFTGQIQLGLAELSDLQSWDNGQKPRTQYNRKGYGRTR